MNVMIKAIQERRLLKGYNFHDIEQATGIPAKRMHSFEKGQTHLSLEETERLFEFLNLKPADLIVTKKRKGKRRPLIFTMLTTILFISVALFFILTMTSGKHELTGADQPLEELGDSADLANPEDEDEAAVVDPLTEKGIRLRFLGNVLYQTDQLPQIDEPESKLPTYEIIPVERLVHGDSLPNWLSAKDKNHLLLNLATRFIWEDGIEKERDRLNKNGYKNVGIDYLAEVYKPYILETEAGKLGILPFTRTILDAEHVAERNEVGLARGNNRSLLLNAISEARKDVDFLVVLIGWGDRDASSRDPKNKELAQELADAGADLIVGNHPIQGQEIEWLDNVPVFYSLGHTVWDQVVQENQELPPDLYSYILDVELVDHKLTDLKIHIGKLKDGVISFDLDENEKLQAEQRILPQTPQLIQIHD